MKPPWEVPGARLRAGRTVTARQLIFSIAIAVWFLVLFLGYRGQLPFAVFAAIMLAAGSVAAAFDLRGYILLFVLLAPLQYSFAYMPYLDEISLRFVEPTTAQALAKDIAYLPIVFVAVGAVVVRRSVPMVMSPLWWFSAALAGYLTVLALWRTNAEWLITVAGLRSLVEFLPLALIVPLVIRTQRDVGRLLRVFLAGAGLVTALTLVEFALPRLMGWRVIDLRLGATLLNPNNLAAFLAVGAVALTAMMLTRSARTRPLWGWMMLGGIVLGLLISQSRAGGFAALAGVMAVLLVAGRKRTAFRALAAVVVIAALLGVLVPSFASRYLFFVQPLPEVAQDTAMPGTVSLYGSGDPDLSARERLGELRRGLQYVGLNPLFGQGLGFAGNVKGAASVSGLPLVALMPHNVYLLMALNGGLIALGLFVVTLCLLAREGLRIAASAGSPDLTALGYGLFGMAVAYGVYGFGAEFIEHFPHSVVFWSAVGVAVSARRLTAEISPAGTRGR